MLTGFPLFLAIFLALLFIVLACSVFRWHPFPVLLVTALVLGLVVGMPAAAVINTALKGGGGVFTAIGFIIALGTVLGTILEKTGAAASLASHIMKRLGPRSLLPGVSLLGALVGIPVFCDSGFVILSNLGRSLALESGVSFGAISVALASGLYSTHVLVPPTPGPLAAAGTLGMENNLGWIIILGLLVSIAPMLVGVFMAKRYARQEKQTMPPPEPPAPVRHGPAFWPSLLPLLLPVVLIAMGTLLTLFPLQEKLLAIAAFICNPTIALLLALILALSLLGRSRQKEWNSWIQQSLSQAGPIILITVAGGALGAILQATDLASAFTHWTTENRMSSLWLYPGAFLLAAALKTAQGSSTAALVVTSSIMVSLMPASGLDSVTAKALLVLSIGGGSMTVSHANDSFFWVISQYAGVPVRDMYRHFTITTLLMGISVLAVCMLLAAIIG